MPAGIVLIGGGSNLYLVEPIAREYLNLPARIAPLSVLFTVPINEKRETEIIKKNVDSSWAIAYGLCTLGENKEIEEFSGSRFVRQTKKQPNKVASSILAIIFLSDRMNSIKTCQKINPEIEVFARIKVIGVGGSGGNAINHMVNSKIKGVEFIAMNTDAQDLLKSLASKKNTHW